MFVSYVPDAEKIGASGVALKLLRSHEGVPPLIQVTERFAEQIGVAVETISGHHAPYLHRPRGLRRGAAGHPAGAGLMAEQRVNGVNLYCEDHGAGAPIVLVHGCGGSALGFSDAVTELAKFGRVTAYDRRGCARSERPEPYERTRSPNAPTMPRCCSMRSRRPRRSSSAAATAGRLRLISHSAIPTECGHWSCSSPTRRAR